MKIHRIVVLPEFQGFGLSMKMVNAISQMYYEIGKRIRTTTNHPASIAGFKKNENWICVQNGRQINNSKTGLKIGGSSSNRITTTWEYVPKKIELFKS